MDDIGYQMVELYQLHGRIIGNSSGLCDALPHASWMDHGDQARSLKILSDAYWPGLENRKMAIYTNLKVCFLDGEVWSWIKA